MDPIDPLLRVPVKVTFIQPFQARKTYLCPGCNFDITPGTGHVVVVPLEENDADLRRHWHRACWDHREKRKPRR